nr:reverse transcriptase domain-containing protein [Tanacetum cinerariifolium]
MPCGSTFETTISLRIFPIVPLSIHNVCVARTSTVTGKVPYFVTLVVLMVTRAIVMKMALGALGQIPTIRLLLTCPHIVNPGDILTFGGLLLHALVNVIRKSANLLFNFLNLISNKLGTDQVLKKKMADKYCPHGEIKKLEIELWNLKVKGNDVPTYTERFQELTLICTKFVANETKKIDKYVSGLPDNIYGSVKASKPKTLDETIELANDLMDQKLRTYAEIGRRTTKGRLMIHSETTMVINNNPSKGKMSTRSTIWGRAKRSSTVEICPSAPSAIFITMARVPKSATSATRNNGANHKGNGYFECGAPGLFKRDFPKLKNKYGGNVNAQGWVYVVGDAEKKGNASRDPDSNVVTDLFGTDIRQEEGRQVGRKATQRRTNRLRFPLSVSRGLVGSSSSSTSRVPD